MPIITRSKAAEASLLYMKEQQDKRSKTVMPVTPPRPQTIQECPPAPSRPIKIDFSKMPKKPVSEGFVFPKSTEQKLAEALAEVERLKKKCKENEKELLDYMIEATADIAGLLSENIALKKKNEGLEAEIYSLKDELTKKSVDVGLQMKAIMKKIYR